MIKVCEYCGEEFETDNKRKVFCSKKCGSKSTVEKNSICLICEYCGIAFLSSKAELKQGRRFCSHICYSLDKKEVKNRLCDCCGKEYNPSSRRDNQKFCSRECYSKVKNDSAKKMLICEYCLKEYEVVGVKNWKPCRTRGERKFCSKECVDKNRIGRFTEDNSPQWRGGRTSLQDLIRKSVDYTRTRSECFERDGHKSVISGDGGILNHHHLISYSILFNQHEITKENWRDYKEILFDIENVVTMTQKEHKSFHSKYGKVTTQEMFEEFKNNY